MRLLTTELVEMLHDAVLNPGALSARALDKSLDGALARVDNRLAYGMITDAFDLAAACAEAISEGRCVNAGNKRTAHQCMDTCLDLNGIELNWSVEDTGQVIIALAQRTIDTATLADWLRAQALA